MLKIAAVVLNWNQSQLTRDCVATLRKSERLCDRIIVVDNGSRPEQLAILTDVRTATDVTYLPLRANRGFAGGMNAGIREAARLGADYVWLVNNDAFPEPNCLTRLLAVMEADTSLACVTPRLLGTDGVEQPSGGRFINTQGRNEFLSSSDLQFPVGRGGYWVVGTIPLFRATALQIANRFDENYFAYWEEVDLCLRLGRLGFCFRSVPEVRALHIGQVSSGDSAFGFYLYVRNWLRLLRKHCHPSVRSFKTVQFIRQILDNAGCFELHGQHAKAQAAIEAILATLSGEVGKPRWFGSAPRLASFLAKHPWQFVKVINFLLRFIGPKPTKGVSA